MSEPALAAQLILNLTKQWFGGILKVVYQRNLQPVMTIPAHKPTMVPRAPLSAFPTHTTIFKAMAEKFGLSSRESQLKLAAQVKATLEGGGVCCIEAPTGTGKTLGYLAGALDAQYCTANPADPGKPMPIVVATATVGLQEQIMNHDIPRLGAVGAVDPRKVVVAKGRGRYFCPRTTALLEDKKNQDT